MFVVRVIKKYLFIIMLISVNVYGVEPEINPDFNYLQKAMNVVFLKTAFLRSDLSVFRSPHIVIPLAYAAVVTVCVAYSLCDECEYQKQLRKNRLKNKKYENTFLNMPACKFKKQANSSL